MFRNKRHHAAPAAPATAANTTPSAATAAAQAFLKQQASNASLSSAAAAAALRSHTTSPEPVGSIQTRRMIRRNSNTSITSNTGSVRQPFSSGLQRRGSQSSMTDRTFRSPSPSVRNGAPPVPAIPEDVPPLPTKSHKRVTSIDPPRFRVASPPPGAHGRNQSVDAMRPVNFSRPISPEPTGTTPRSPVRARPASSLGFAPIQETQLQREIQAAHQRKLLSKGGGAGPAARSTTPQRMPLTAGTGPAAMTAATSAASLMAQNVAVSQPQTRAAPGVPQARSTGRPINPNAVLSNARMGPSAPRPRLQAAATAGTVPAPAPPRPASAQSNVRPRDSNVPPVPSVVRPSSALAHARPQSPPMSRNEEILAAAKAKFGVQTRSLPTTTKDLGIGAVPPPSADQIKKFQTRASAMLARRPSEEYGHPSEEKKREEILRATPGKVAVASTQPKTDPITTPAKQITSNATRLTPSTAETDRRQSPSPTRSARFSDRLVNENLKHEPSKRGLSPYKSALKGHSSRSTSPAGSTNKAMSDTSDARSDDGHSISAKKKKSVRVSFEERPIMVGEAAGIEPSADTILSPQYAKTMAADEDEAGMGTRPILPSFGSVRKGQIMDGDKTASEITKGPPVNNVLPDVESKQIEAVDDLAAAGLPQTSDTLAPSATGSDTTVTPTGTVPSIAVIPGTPRVDEQDEFIPPVQKKAETSIVDEKPRRSLEDALSAADVQNVLDSHPKEIIDETVVGVIPEEPVEEAESLDDTADVPEETDLTAGYSSLDAILESPTAELEAVKIADASSPTVADALSEADAQPRAEDWNEVAAYWTGLSEQKKRQMEEEAAAQEAAQGKAEVKAANGHADAGSAPLPPWPDQEYQKSVKKEVPPMKMSMRGTNAQTKASTTASRRGTQDTEQATAPSSPTPLTVGALRNLAKPKLSRSNSNDSDDSESSFRRMRQGRAKSGADANGGRVAMKRSMRSDQQTPNNSASAPSARVSLRNQDRQSASANVQRYTMSAPARGPVNETGGMHSLRGAGQQPAKGGSSLFGKAKGNKAKGQSSKGSRFSSRFVDSSDEEDGGATRGFFSRFKDSDDEDAMSPPTSPRRFRPVRGIPKKAGHLDYDSSDLSESEGEGVPQPKTLRQHARNSSVAEAAPAANGLALSAGTLRTTDSPKSKRGFLGLSKKKTNTGTNVAAMAILESRATEEITTPHATPGETPTASPKATKQSRLSRSFRRLSISSTPEPDRTGNFKGEFPFPPPPIPEVQETSRERPITSDGISSHPSIRPPLNKRESAMTAPTGARNEKVTIVSERTGKKKKFQGLRRLFGLND